MTSEIRSPDAECDVRSHMAAVEASVDRDYLRFKARSSGRRAMRIRLTNKATGFDAIFDDPNFVGGQFSFWNRNGIRLTQTGVGLVQPNSLVAEFAQQQDSGPGELCESGNLYLQRRRGCGSHAANQGSLQCQLSAVSSNRAAGVRAVSKSHSARHRIGLQSGRRVPAVSDQ